VVFELRKSGAKTAWLNAHGLIVRRSELIIGNVREENIGNGIREMPGFGRAGAIDGGGGCETNWRNLHFDPSY
jgi:hypothetical protein